MSSTPTRRGLRGKRASSAPHDCSASALGLVGPGSLLRLRLAGLPAKMCANNAQRSRRSRTSRYNRMQGEFAVHVGTGF